MIRVAPGLFYRHLDIGEVLRRQRARHELEVARHNAGVVEQLDLTPRAAVRDQVLAEFPAATRRMVR